jgi:hypothetical protein
MDRFDPALFNSADAEIFVRCLFKTNKTAEDIPPEYFPFYRGPLVSPEDAADIQNYIIDLYRFYKEKETADWTVPLLDFLKNLPSNDKKQK